MNQFATKRLLPAALALAAALLSLTLLARVTADPAFFQSARTALDEKQSTVLELTAASTAASAAISLLPGDSLTPLAEKLADLSGYFLIVLCAVFLEKYLLSITALAAFKLLIPAGFLLLAAALLVPRLRAVGYALAGKLLLFGLAIVLVIPTGVRVSALIEDTYHDSIEATMEDARNSADALSDGASGTEEDGTGGLFSAVANGISQTVSRAAERVKTLISRFLEALAVLLVTSCLIPILVLLFFVWIVKLALGIRPGAFGGPRAAAAPSRDESPLR